MAVGEKNAYYCDTCANYVVTIDVDDGVTPMFLACRALGDPEEVTNTCGGMMRSMMYPPEPWPEHDGYGEAIPTEPTWEWYQPDPVELAGVEDGVREHVELGGLLLRARS